MLEFQACEQTALTQSTCPGKDGLEGMRVACSALGMCMGMACLVCCMCVVRVLMSGQELNSHRSLQPLLGFVSCPCWFPFARVFQLSSSPLLFPLRVKQV